MSTVEIPVSSFEKSGKKKNMFNVVTKYGKVLCTMSTRERAELWLMHYEDAYGLEDLKIVESDVL